MVEELAQFLLPPQRMDVRAVALVQVLGLTGTPEGVATLRAAPSILRVLVSLLRDPNEVLATDACLALINLSADEATVPSLLEVKDIVSNLYQVRGCGGDRSLKSPCADHTEQGEQAGGQGHPGPLQPHPGPGELRQSSLPVGGRWYRSGQFGDHPLP